jgi:hypothetical protein
MKDKKAEKKNLLRAAQRRRVVSYRISDFVQASIWRLSFGADCRTREKVGNMS